MSQERADVSRAQALVRGYLWRKTLREIQIEFGAICEEIEGPSLDLQQLGFLCGFSKHRSPDTESPPASDAAVLAQEVCAEDTTPEFGGLLCRDLEKMSVFDLAEEFRQLRAKVQTRAGHLRRGSTAS
mmetsp:Transcript_13025/g.48322  ORF Transcript_13025/g.48322 Transcript_13025/m.48322 type:complete len:128 (-) Transcript_13025:5188-5571(-)|eukprot:scaffold703_cov245-Pinguiococcus_pyrenoidosus.AAC.14